MNPDQKMCPLLTAVAQIPLGPVPVEQARFRLRAGDPGTCLEARCAWWAGSACAILDLGRILASAAAHREKKEGHVI